MASESAGSKLEADEPCPVTQVAKMFGYTEFKHLQRYSLEFVLSRQDILGASLLSPHDSEFHVTHY